MTSNYLKRYYIISYSLNSTELFFVQKIHATICLHLDEMEYYFLQIRKTKTVSAFPVGIVAGQYVSTPVLNKNGKFLKFFDGWNGGRKYIIDMAGFAVGVYHYVKMADKFNEVKRNFTIMKFRRGYEENSFLINMRVPPKKFEFLCDNCQKVLYILTSNQKTFLPTNILKSQLILVNYRSMFGIHKRKLQI